MALGMWSVHDVLIMKNCKTHPPLQLENILLQNEEGELVAKVAGELGGGAGGGPLG